MATERTTLMTRRKGFRRPGRHALLKAVAVGTLLLGTSVGSVVFAAPFRFPQAPVVPRFPQPPANGEPRTAGKPRVGPVVRRGPEAVVRMPDSEFRVRVPRNDSFLQQIGARLQASGAASQLGLVSSGSLGREEITRNVEKNFLRATRRGVAKLLVEAADIDLGSSPGPTVGSDLDGEGSVRFRLGVSHLAPKVDMRYEIGHGAVNVSVGALGHVGVDLSHARLASTQIHAGYNKSTRTYSLLCRFGF